MNWYFDSLPYLQDEEASADEIRAKFGLKTRFYEAQASKRGIATARHLELRNATKALRALASDFPSIFVSAGFGPDSRIGDTRTIIDLVKISPRLSRADFGEHLERFLTGHLSRRQMQAKLALIQSSAGAASDESVDPQLLQSLASDFSAVIGASSTRWLMEFDRYRFPVDAIGVSFARNEASIDGFIYANGDEDLDKLRMKERIRHTLFDRIWVAVPYVHAVHLDLDLLEPYGVIGLDLIGALSVARQPDIQSTKRSPEEALYRALLSLVRRQ